jgi:hypothetical protein
MESTKFPLWSLLLPELRLTVRRLLDVEDRFALALVSHAEWVEWKEDGLAVEPGYVNLFDPTNQIRTWPRTQLCIPGTFARFLAYDFYDTLLLALQHLSSGAAGKMITVIPASDYILPVGRLDFKARDCITLVLIRPNSVAEREIAARYNLKYTTN